MIELPEYSWPLRSDWIEMSLEAKIERVDGLIGLSDRRRVPGYTSKYTLAQSMARDLKRMILDGEFGR